MQIRRPYVIVFGDLDKHLIHVNRPLEEHLELIPAIEIFQCMFPEVECTSDNILQAAKDAMIHVMFGLMDYYPDKATLLEAIKQHPMEFDTIDMEFPAMIPIYSVNKELVCLRYDRTSMKSAHLYEQSNFPDAWEPVSKCVKLKSGPEDTLVTTSGTADLLDLSLFDGVSNFDPNCGYLSYFNCMVLNAMVIEKDPEAPFVILKNPNPGAKVVYQS
jgi:hypothetical protein